jgi:uncharacterized protein (DUF2126 family)
MGEATTDMSTATTQAVRARTLVSEEFFHRVAARVAVEMAMPVERAERVVDQALAFVAACRDLPAEGRISPSPAVDDGDNPPREAAHRAALACRYLQYRLTGATEDAFAGRV